MPRVCHRRMRLAVMALCSALTACATVVPPGEGKISDDIPCSGDEAAYR